MIFFFENCILILIIFNLNDLYLEIKFLFRYIIKNKLNWLMGEYRGIEFFSYKGLLN